MIDVLLVVHVLYHVMDTGLLDALVVLDILSRGRGGDTSPYEVMIFINKWLLTGGGIIPLMIA